MRYSIENELLKVTADTLGAELVSVINKKTNEEMIWQADPSVWDRHCPVLFPYCGKLKDGKYRLDDKEYEGDQHGFIRDLEHTFIEAKENEMRFLVNSNEETIKLFPRNFAFETKFTLRGNTLIHSLVVYNKDYKDLRFGIGYHPAFNFPFDDKHTTLDYELQFDIPQTVVVKENYTSGPFLGFVSGEKTVMTENSKVIPLHDRIFDLDSLCLTNLTAKTLSIVEKDTNRKVTVNIDGFPYVQLWSMVGTPTLRFLAIEPWLSVQDSAKATGNWNEKPCAEVLKPHERWQTDLFITFDR